ncbi:MAG TPA: prephenate dehydrogenase/arogenate dehydrogenase family protein, partial [Candidatus Dormibacteraeota bacterium]|nr:prephenate dehydrogenase/arogenate dehydrogenase family protein [Candidatus Dormibacteraeota bacterium]
MPTVAVVGLGLMGASFALALKKTRPDITLVGSDRNPLVVRKALDRGIVVTANTDLTVVEVADLVVIGAPLGAMRELFAQLALLAGGMLITDMASTKADVMEWAAAEGIDLVGGHPMCGKERSGIDHADASMFEGAPWVLTRDEPRITQLVEAVGARPIVLDAVTHDRLVAGVSHAAFLLSVGYVLAMARRDDWPEASGLAAGGFRDMSRLAAGDPDLYAGVVRTNRENLVEMLDAISAELARLRRHLEADDPRIIELFEEARRVRER